MAGEALQADVVMCLGFLYHTTRYNELLHHIRATGARILIIDTEIVQGIEPFVSLRTENVERQGNAVPRPVRSRRPDAGRPAVAPRDGDDARGLRIRHRSPFRLEGHPS